MFNYGYDLISAHSSRILSKPDMFDGRSCTDADTKQSAEFGETIVSVFNKRPVKNDDVS
jgi:hypothetical protein